MLTFLELWKLDEAIISPSTEPNTLTLYHGGNLDFHEEYISHKNGRHEYGSGLYCTTHYGTAKRYAKGSRKLYQIVISKGVDLRDATLDKAKIEQFVKENISKKNHKEFWFSMDRYTKDGQCDAKVFSNIINNNNYIPSSKTNVFRKFFVDNGIDYEIVPNAFGWGETMVVLYNMKKIVSKVIITPKDKLSVYDLPTGFT
jgi:hypothetical protein